jgi:2-iminobutanoate/2-iminopropanoate deaminase
MQIINTPKAPKAIGPYSQAIDANGFVFISGQIPVDPKTGSAVDRNIEAQSEMVFKNIGAILDEAGLSFKDVVKTTCFIADMKDFAVINSIYEKYFISKPARSCIAVKQLPKNVLIEVEVIACKETK